VTYPHFQLRHGIEGEARLVRFGAETGPKPGELKVEDLAAKEGPKEKGVKPLTPEQMKAKDIKEHADDMKGSVEKRGEKYLGKMQQFAEKMLAMMNKLGKFKTDAEKALAIGVRLNTDMRIVGVKGSGGAPDVYDVKVSGKEVTVSLRKPGAPDAPGPDGKLKTVDGKPKGAEVGPDGKPKGAEGVPEGDTNFDKLKGELKTLKKEFEAEKDPIAAFGKMIEMLMKSLEGLGLAVSGDLGKKTPEALAKADKFKALLKEASGPDAPKLPLKERLAALKTKKDARLKVLKSEDPKDTGSVPNLKKSLTNAQTAEKELKEKKDPPPATPEQLTKAKTLVEATQKALTAAEADLATLTADSTALDEMAVSLQKAAELMEDVFKPLGGANAFAKAFGAFEFTVGGIAPAPGAAGGKLREWFPKADATEPVTPDMLKAKLAEVAKGGGKPAEKPAEPAAGGPKPGAKPAEAAPGAGPKPVPGAPKPGPKPGEPPAGDVKPAEAAPGVGPETGGDLSTQVSKAADAIQKQENAVLVSEAAAVLEKPESIAFIKRTMSFKDLTKLADTLQSLRNLSDPKGMFRAEPLDTSGTPLRLPVANAVTELNKIRETVRLWDEGKNPGSENPPKVQARLLVSGGADFTTDKAVTALLKEVPLIKSVLGNQLPKFTQEIQKQIDTNAQLTDATKAKMMTLKNALI
jgi:hypothetical protein